MVEDKFMGTLMFCKTSAPNIISNYRNMCLSPEEKSVVGATFSSF
jgi:hypothetical protein